MVSFLSMTNSVLTWHVEDLVSGFVWEIEFKLNCKKVVQILGFRYGNATVVENTEKMVGSYLPAYKGRKEVCSLIPCWRAVALTIGANKPSFKKKMIALSTKLEKGESKFGWIPPHNRNLTPDIAGVEFLNGPVYLDSESSCVGRYQKGDEAIKCGDAENVNKFKPKST
ncbi:unnamed protein product [Malus baccata var. baccata]